MERFLLVCLGGAAGTGTRYGAGLLFARLWGTAFPFGTLAVNLLGCLLMGAAMELASHGALKSETARLAVTTGFLGGLTTYSAFNLETTSLFQKSGPLLGIGYFTATATGCVFLGLTGTFLARRFLG